MPNQILKHLILVLFICIQTFTLAQNSTVKGIVRDAQNNRPLPFANISIVGKNIGTSTAENGTFFIENLPAGFIVLEISYLGYLSKQTQQILLNNNKTTYIEITLEPQAKILSDVVIRPASFVKKESSPISMQSIGIREIENNPGSNRDVSRVIQAFPGVGATPAFRNDIIIRGGGPSENRFFLDEVEIPVLNHFSTQGASGGSVGIINADFVRNIDFYSSAFPSAKYNALSGILDIKQKDGNTDKTNMQFAIGASEASLTLDGPIGKKTTYIASARRSYLQFLFSAIGLPFLPTFNDYQIKTKTQFNQNNELTIISIGALDQLRINNKIKNPTPSQEAIKSSIPINNQWSYTIGAVYKHFFKKGYHTLVVSRNKLNNELYKYPENDESQAKTFDYVSSETENKLRYEYHLRHSGVKYVLSSNLEIANYSNTTKQKVLMWGNILDINYHTALKLFKYGFSGQATRRFFDEKFLVSTGFRFDANNYNEKTANLWQQFSPRIALSYNLNENFKLNASAGRYFQQNAYTTLGYRNENGILVNHDEANFIGLHQYNLSAEHYWGDKILLSVEGFYKNYFNYPIALETGLNLANQGANYFIYGGNSVRFDGKGKTYGVEILNRWNYDTFTILASYTFFRSRFTNMDGDYLPSAWDSKHLFSLTVNKKLKKNWQVGAKWRYVGGLPYTPYDLKQSAIKEIWRINHGAVLDNSLLNSQRNKAFHQLDIRVDKQFFFKKWTLMAYFDIQNAYNFKSDTPDIIIRKKNTDGSYQTTPDGKNYILESHKDTFGTVLPTLGIMVKF